MKDLTIFLEDRPGTLADMGEALGKAGVNIEGASGFPCEGKGLGLYLSKRIVESYGGTIKLLEEKEGDGASFLISVPI